MAFKFNKDQLRRLESAINESVYDYTKELANIIIEKEVIPYDTGYLQDHQGVIKLNNGKARLYYDAPYAKRVYYLPEKYKIHNGEEEIERKYTIHREKRSKAEVAQLPPGAKRRNRWATRRWVEKVIQDTDNKKIYAEFVMLYLKDGVTGYQKKNKPKKSEIKKPKDTPKPIEKPAATAKSTRPAWQQALDNKARGLDAGGRPSRPPVNPMVRPAGPKPKK